MLDPLDWVEQPSTQRPSRRRNSTRSQDNEASAGPGSGIGHSHRPLFEFSGWNLDKFPADSKGRKIRKGRR